jgi:hypothetical protein
MNHQAVAQQRFRFSRNHWPGFAYIFMELYFFI